MSLVTTELAPMTAPSPIDTPLSTHTFSPSQTFEPMETGAMERGLVLGSVEGWLDPYSPCPESLMNTLEAKRHRSPMATF